MNGRCEPTPIRLSAADPWRSAIRLARRLAYVTACAMACSLTLLASCNRGDPFSYVRVSGKVTYEDGSLIPAGVLLTFYPQGGDIDAKTHPRPGETAVNQATGEFHSVTSHKLNDGLVRGKHKVTLRDGWHRPLPPNIVPEEYSDFSRTPLEVDTADRPFHLRVKKP
jgi:hypothetical protein